MADGKSASALRRAAAAANEKDSAYDDSGPSAVRIPKSELLSINSRRQITGLTSTVSERHLSYLLREWEINKLTYAGGSDGSGSGSGGDVTVEDDSVDYLPNDYHSNPELRTDNPSQPYWPGWIGLIAFATFVVSFAALVSYETAHGLKRIDSIILSMMATHVMLYVVILRSTGYGMYRAWSIRDGWNTVTRFTLKLTVPTEPCIFSASNMPCNISSSVSTRGSTLNKIMTGMSYSIGLSLFIKFAELYPAAAAAAATATSSASSVHITRAWSFCAGFGYLLIVLTGLFENRTFDLDEAFTLAPADDGSGRLVQVPSGITHHRKRTLRGLGAGEQAMKHIDQSVTSPAFSNFHSVGVMGFVFMSFVGLCGDYAQHVAAGNANEYQRLALGLSVTGVLFALVFVWMNKTLTAVAPPTSGLLSLSWLTAPASPTVNGRRGRLCILVELIGLAACGAAGVVYQI